MFIYRIMHLTTTDYNMHQSLLQVNIKYKTNVYLFQQNEEFEGTNTFLFIPQIFCFLY